MQRVMLGTHKIHVILCVLSITRYREKSNFKVLFGCNITHHSNIITYHPITHHLSLKNPQNKPKSVWQLNTVNFSFLKTQKTHILQDSLTVYSFQFPYAFFAFPLFSALVFTSQTPKPKDHPSINSSILAHLHCRHVTLPRHHPPSSFLNPSRYTSVLQRQP